MIGSPTFQTFCTMGPSNVSYIVIQLLSAGKWSLRVRMDFAMLPPHIPDKNYKAET